MSESLSAKPGPREVLARYHRAMLDKSADDLADLYAVDGVHEFPLLAPGFPARFHGREEVRAGYGAAWGASPARVEEIRNVVVHETTDPDLIVAEQDIAAVVTTTGRRFTIACLLVMRVRDGLIVHLRDYMDALGAARALDRLPALVAGLSGQPGSGQSSQVQRARPMTSSLSDSDSQGSSSVNIVTH